MKKKVWALLDDRAGNVNQVKGVCLELDDYEVIEKNISYTKLGGLPNFIRDASLLGVDIKSKNELLFEKEFPDFVIAAGRKTAPIARWIKKESAGKTKLIQIMYPGDWGRSDFEKIFVPEHDIRVCKKAKNVEYITGAPHKVNEKTLKEAKSIWEERFAHLPKPHTSIIIGGAVGKKKFTAEQGADLGKSIAKLHEKIGGSLLITTSRRTGKDAEDAIMNELNSIPNFAYLWGSKGENPYLGFLACADKIIVTGDSVSMCSEACGTGVDVYIFSKKEMVTRKHLRFQKSLFENGYAKELSIEKLENNNKEKMSQKLNAARYVADIIKKL